MPFWNLWKKVTPLEDHGFVEAGKWELANGVRSGIRFSLRRLAERRVVYAFVVDQVPKYIGVCDTSRTTLKDRMQRYQAKTGGGTNERIAELIRRCLVEGRTVKIFAMLPGQAAPYKNLQLDLVRGLEYPLIERLKPEWNIHK